MTLFFLKTQNRPLVLTLVFFCIIINVEMPVRPVLDYLAGILIAISPNCLNK